VVVPAHCICDSFCFWVPISRFKNPARMPCSPDQEWVAVGREWNRFSHDPPSAILRVLPQILRIHDENLDLRDILWP
jgi:hypothetical protein